MTLEVFNEHLRSTDEDVAGAADSQVVRETTEAGQIVWLNSAPTEPKLETESKPLTDSEVRDWMDLI